ncbi:hypothetical protein PVAG01_04322 [Phlyctema vagabunda]|uniref:Uncharacterized protein n=1 Tax=Phlyctema vagabunda TaxID=108571 RepID=A0ABR4PNW7_9HELO
MASRNKTPIRKTNSNPHLAPYGFTGGPRPSPKSRRSTSTTATTRRALTPPDRHTDLSTVVDPDDPQLRDSQGRPYRYWKLKRRRLMQKHQPAGFVPNIRRTRNRDDWSPSIVVNTMGLAAKPLVNNEQANGAPGPNDIPIGGSVQSHNNMHRNQGAYTSIQSGNHANFGQPGSTQTGIGVDVVQPGFAQPDTPADGVAQHSNISATGTVAFMMSDRQDYKSPYAAPHGREWPRKRESPFGRYTMEERIEIGSHMDEGVDCFIIRRPDGVIEEVSRKEHEVREAMALNISLWGDVGQRTFQECRARNNAVADMFATAYGLDGKAANRYDNGKNEE